MLTDAKIRTLPLPERGRKKYADSGGLSLLVSPSGGKVWYLRKRVDGKEQMINLGQYPSAGKGKNPSSCDVWRCCNRMAGHYSGIKAQSGICPRYLNNGLSAISCPPLPVAP
ncbi:Arm DNA-binding domain-containing protein [uncultured Desulfovibrio sp.]|uniref:Arm DNA-binding domain-containing protein n=1 Tax=uncultured Desulfovibrio sp. TaxID=167968 RepID=UPI00345BAD61